MTTSLHSIKRTQKRAGLSKKTSEKFIINAIENGRGIESFSDAERDYLMAKEAKEGCRAIVHDEYCFIIGDNDCCVTMYHVPVWFEKKSYFDGKKIIRNIKKYIRYNNSLANDYVA